MVSFWGVLEFLFTGCKIIIVGLNKSIYWIKEYNPTSITSHPVNKNSETPQKLPNHYTNINREKEVSTLRSICTPLHNYC